MHIKHNNRLKIYILLIAHHSKLRRHLRAQIFRFPCHDTTIGIVIDRSLRCAIT